MGLGIGTSLLEFNPQLKVLIIDKEPAIALHASTRNSGVIHAGFYYSPDSLKAKFSKQGNYEIKKLLKQNNMPFLESGKLILAKNEEDLNSFETLLSRGNANGVELEILDARLLKSFEPLAKTYKRFIWSPKTAVTDPAYLIEGLRRKFIGLGGKFEFSKEINLIDEGGEINLKGKFFSFNFLINAAGAHSLRLAKQIGVAKNYTSMPFRGTYWMPQTSHFKLERLIYPVPHRVNPFLGVHFTNTIDGNFKVGPTALPVLGPESYISPTKANFFEISETLNGWKFLALGKTHSTKNLVASEIKRLFLRNIINEASILVPEVANIQKWVKKNSGIRAQLVSNSSGELVQDFVVELKNNSIHILNVVSPGWTSAIPFSRWIVEKYLIQ